MSRVALRGRVVTDYEVWEEGVLILQDGLIYDVLPDSSSLRTFRRADIHDYPDALILPGFVDLQLNGAFGIDAATEPERLGELSRRLLETGTTSYLPTIITSPESLYERTLPALAKEIEDRRGDGAEPLGVHLEGPFVALDQRKAHPAANVLPPDAAFLEWLLSLAPVRMVTLAPELDGADELAEVAARRGAVVSAGHSEASFEVAYDGMDGKVASVTHLFNAMNRLHHRAPGLAGAAFAHPRVVCGLIADGLHVHPEMVALAYRMLGPDRTCLVTDAISAAGMGPGEYSLATRRVYLEDDGVPKLGSGVIAGSVLTMNEAFQNILAFTGCTIPEAARMTTSTPARLVGEGRRKGRLMPGYDADVTVIAPDLGILAVWKAGEPVHYGGRRTV